MMKLIMYNLMIALIVEIAEVYHQVLTYQE